jgi:hypothetical protein
MVHSVEKNGRKRIDIRIGTLIPPQEDIDLFTEAIQSKIQALAEETKTYLETRM